MVILTADLARMCWKCCHWHWTGPICVWIHSSSSHLL